MATQPRFSQFKNPYKFSVYRNAAQNSGNGVDAIVNFDTANFDTSGNVDLATNVGRFTAPVAGFYWFYANVSASFSTSQYPICSIYKNGSVFLEGFRDYQTATFIHSAHVGALMQLAKNDFVEIYFAGDGGALRTTNKATHFDGFLVSIA